MEYMHPGYRKMYPITTVLRDLAAQEGCDGEPYDVMIAAADHIARLTAERDAIAAAAYERAAQWHDDVAAHDQSGIDYSDAVGVPISNRGQLAESVRQHEYSAREIRALATEAENTALAEMLDAETRACADLFPVGSRDGDMIRSTILARIDQRKEAV